MAAKKRIAIPPDIAARVLFEADRICCVCRVRLKPVQIHHIDDNPANNSVVNLAVLCFDCHRETQIAGGFDRKLDADQVILYRDDWKLLVSQRRSAEEVATEARRIVADKDMALAMTIAEIYREAKAYFHLAIHYDILGNTELRDKYIELALVEDGADDDLVIYLRGLQGCVNKIPGEVIVRRLEELTEHEDWSQRARLLVTLGRGVEAAADYVLSIHKNIQSGSYFPAAFYLKELSESGLNQNLFEAALRDAQARQDLWWQVRCLQELGWKDALDELVLEHASEIEGMDVSSGTVAQMLRQLLAAARGDRDELARARQDEARVIAAQALRRHRRPVRGSGAKPRKRRRQQAK